jgi:hypothetical protein
MELIDLSRELFHRINSPVIVTVWGDHSEKKVADNTVFTSEARAGCVPRWRGGAGMAKMETKRLAIQSASVRKELQEASQSSGKTYELALGECIAKRKIPVLEMIENETGIPVVGVSMDRTRGPKSSQSQAWFQWQRGHRRDGTRWPDATIEFAGAGSVINRVYALEISLQTDVTQIGSSPGCSMSMAKASQIALTAAILASKPAYRSADICYWYLCPWEPIQETRSELLIPLQNMKGTDKVALTWLIVDHGK